MVSSVEKTDIKVLKAYSDDKVWNVVISFPEELEGYKNNSKLAGPVEYVLYQIQGWTDEPVDLNELRLMAFNESTSEYKLVKGDNDNVPERVQYAMLSAAREAMSAAEEALSSK